MANQREGTHDTKGCLEDPLWFQGKSLIGRILSGDLDMGPTYTKFRQNKYRFSSEFGQKTTPWGSGMSGSAFDNKYP